jgi:hypothetical protein
MPGTSNFPGALDTFPEIEPNTKEDAPGLEHDVVHDNVHAALAAVEAKVGIDGSADPDSLDFRVAALEDDKIDTAEKGAANGVATLGADSKVPAAQLPLLALTDVYVVASESAQLALTAEEGDVAIRSDLNRSYVRNGGTAGTMADWSELLSPTAPVLSVAGKTGAVALDAADIASGQFAAARLATGSPVTGDVPTRQSDGSVAWAPQSGGGGGGSANRCQQLTFAAVPSTDAIATGTKARFYVEVAMTITTVTILANASGSLVVDLWVEDYAGSPPDASDSICGAAKPTLSSAQKMLDSTLTGWTVDIPAGSWVIANVDSCSGINAATLAVAMIPTPP